jgi:tRNA1(Val) A37 N6-methylase TrmN6
MTLYRFNRYVNGHNEAGFVTKQISFTSDQINKRNASIKRAYAQKQEIKEKISAAVTKRKLEDPTYTINLSNASAKRWSDPEYRSMMSDAQRKSWSENHDERCARVFTEEFSKKISAANARRDQKRTSKVEAEFVEKLRSLLPQDDVQSSKWFNFDERHVCADAWSKSLNAIFELDGDYWHGLDRRSDFTRDQLHNMATDLRKDLLFSSRSCNVFRFTESDNSWRVANSLESFLSASRHCMIDGEIIQDGLFMFTDDNHPVLTRDALLITDRKDRETLLEPLVDFVTAYVSHRGFFYPSNNEALADVLCDVAAGKSNAGTAFLQSCFRSFWHVLNGPAESCLDERTMRSVLAYRIGLNDSIMYDYEVNGKKIVSNEMFDISPKQIRRGCVVQRKAVSWFRSSLAAKIWKHLLRDKSNPVVWDPSSGFGARLLGFASTYPDGTYVGNEPAKMTYADNVNLANVLMTDLLTFTAIVINSGSELEHPEKESCDAVFTSPPFFDREKYFDEPGQCWRDHSTLESWRDAYVVPTLLNAQTALKSGGYLALHLPLNLVDLFIKAAADNCIDLVRVPESDIELELRIDHFSKVRGLYDNKKELLITWQKILKS